MGNKELHKKMGRHTKKMNLLFISSGRRAKEITEALKCNNIKVKTIIKPSFFQILFLLFEKYDLIHADNALHHGLMAVILSKIKRKKCTCLIRGCGVHMQKNKRYGLTQQIWVTLCERICFRYMNHIFFISKNTEETF